jgi:eukaryotic-like serine/threonine-protein kinase
MPRTALCPDAQELQRFSLGQTPDPGAELVEEHLTHCPHCLDLVNRLQAEDTLVQLLRGQKQFPDLADDERLNDQIARLCQLPAVLSGGESGSDKMLGNLLAPAQASDELGRLGPYRVLKVLGAGGMGVVFQADDPAHGRIVALKVMKPDLAVNLLARQRFLREAQATAALRHEHILTIYEVNEDRGMPYLAMEFLQGETLADRIKRDMRLPLTDVLRIGREIGQGLAIAHARGLIHRDIKPANIWLDAFGGRVVLLDFGLARPITTDTQLTQSDMIIGTPAYMAPEQARGDATDGRADLFSLGVVLYRLCAGQMPWTGKHAMGTLIAMATDEPVSVAELNRDIPQPLANLVMRLLAKKVDARPATALEVIDDLRQLERALQPPESPATVREPQPSGGETQRQDCSAPLRSLPDGRLPARRYRWALVAMLLFLAGVGLVAGGIVYVQTDAGTLKIETADDDVQVLVEQNGKIVKTIDKKTGAEVVLHSGEYRLRLGQERKDIKLSHERIQILRGQTVVATISGASKPPDPAPAANEDAWCREVAQYPADKQVRVVLDKLRELNPKFSDADARSVIRNGVVTELHLVAYYLTDLSPVRALKKLEQLSCDRPPHWAPALVDLSPLRGLRLQSLSCQGTGVSDLSPLKGMPLRTLDVSGTRVSNLEPLHALPLRYLDISNTPVENLEPLRRLQLEDLRIAGTNVVDLAPLADLRLKDLHGDFQPERDAPVLRSIKTLAFVNDLPIDLFWNREDAKP